MNGSGCSAKICQQILRMNLQEQLHIVSGYFRFASLCHCFHSSHCLRVNSTGFHTGSGGISSYRGYRFETRSHAAQFTCLPKSANEVVTNLFSRRWPMVAADNCIAAQHHLLCAVKSWEDWDLIIQEPGADHDQQPDTTTGKTWIWQQSSGSDVLMYLTFLARSFEDVCRWAMGTRNPGISARGAERSADHSRLARVWGFCVARILTFMAGGGSFWFTQGPGECNISYCHNALRAPNNYIQWPETTWRKYIAMFRADIYCEGHAEHPRLHIWHAKIFDDRCRCT